MRSLSSSLRGPSFSCNEKNSAIRISSSVSWECVVEIRRKTTRAKERVQTVDFMVVGEDCVASVEWN